MNEEGPYLERCGPTCGPVGTEMSDCIRRLPFKGRALHQCSSLPLLFPSRWGTNTSLWSRCIMMASLPQRTNGPILTHSCVSHKCWLNRVTAASSFLFKLSIWIFLQNYFDSIENSFNKKATKNANKLRRINFREILKFWKIVIRNRSSLPFSTEVPKRYVWMF